MRLQLGLRRLLGSAGAFALIVTIVSAATAGAQAIDPAVLVQLAPTGKLRVGVAAGLTPGTGNVAIAPGAARPQGIGADLGAALGTRLGMAVEWREMVQREEVAMAGSSRVKWRRPLCGSAAFAIVGILVLTAGAGRLSAQARDGSPGPLADSCGVPTASASAAGGGGAGGGRGTPVFGVMAESWPGIARRKRA
jgi:hypothetical protein